MAGGHPPKDAMDRILDAVERLEGEVKNVRGDLDILRGDVKGMHDRQRVTERRIATVEKADQLHTESIRQASESDAKISSDHAAFIIALQETKKAANHASIVATQALTKMNEVEKDQKAIVTAQSDKKTPVTLAALLNLAIGLLYVILEALRHMGH